MNTVDINVIVQPVLAVIGAVIASLLAIYVPKILMVLQARIGLQLTDQQRATVLGAVQTAAGIVETKLDQKALAVSQVTISDPAMRAEAQQVITAVPTAAAALGMTVDNVSRMIVGAVDTGSRAVPTPVTVAGG